VEPDEGPEEEGPFFAWLPPDDRLWRHPSERADAPQAEGAPQHARRRSGRIATLTGRFRNTGTRIWIIAILAGLIGAVAASGIGMVTGVFERQTTVVHSVISTGPAETLASQGGSNVDWSNVDDAIAPSVVEIDVSTASGPASGSGFLFVPGERETYVITESSLVANATDIHVTFNSGDQYRARVVGQDPVTGVALISVPTWDRPFPQLGSVASLHVANQLLAVGARTASGSVVTGSVTAEARSVDVAGGTTMQNLIGVSGPPLPSTAAGGPLVDDQGRVVGITLSLDPVNSSDQALTFAAPVDVAVHVVQQMLSGSAVTHPWLGVTSASDITSGTAQQYGLIGGAQIEQVSPGSPASRLGLGPTDIITSFDNQAVVSGGSLTQLVSQAQLGRPLTLAYLHQGKPVHTSVYLWNQPNGD
jgi:putative serine protease PepD